MIRIEKFHPNIQLLIHYLSNPAINCQKMADEDGITKQAINKRLQKTAAFLSSYGNDASQTELQLENERLKKEIEKKDKLLVKLKLQLVTYSATVFLLTCFKEYVQKHCPRFGLNRFSADQKFQLLTLLWKYIKLGGIRKDFCKTIGKSPETIARWERRFKEEGKSGLHDKTTRPKNFGNKITIGIKRLLLALFIRFPYWNDYQYHKYLRFSPEVSFYVSLPTIQKVRIMHKKRSQEETERIKKRWCFAPGTDAWIIDFSCIHKTETYKLQLLTVSDSRSRFLFKTGLFLETSTEKIIEHLKDLFIKYGKPTIIKADNGPEFRIECNQGLRKLAVYLINSPPYHAPFNGSHERIHRTLKSYISVFEQHRNLTKLVEEINEFEDEYNYKLPHEYLEGKTPADVYFNDKKFIAKEIEQVRPYEKNGELRIKFTNRNGDPARIAAPLIQQ